MANDGSESSAESNELAALRAFVTAHDVPDPRSGTREPIYYLRFHGDLMHHALPEVKPHIDEALIDEMYGHGLISIDFAGDGNTWRITPTSLGRSVVAEDDRINAQPTADVAPIVKALERQNEAKSSLAWPAVRPVLEALNHFWTEAGFPPGGVPLLAVARAVPDDLVPLFAATTRALVGGGYLLSGQLGGVITAEGGPTTEFPGEVAFTEKAHTILDGWPGAAPTELAENLIAVLTAEVAQEEEPTRRRRLEATLGALRELGVSVTSDVLAKVITGGIA